MALTSLTPLTSLTSQAETFGFNSLKKLLHDIGLADKVDDFGHITESQTSNRIGTTIITAMRPVSASQSEAQGKHTFGTSPTHSYNS